MHIAALFATETISQPLSLFWSILIFISTVTIVTMVAIAIGMAWLTILDRRDLRRGESLRRELRAAVNGSPLSCPACDTPVEVDSLAYIGEGSEFCWEGMCPECWDFFEVDRAGAVRSLSDDVGNF